MKKQIFFEEAKRLAEEAAAVFLDEWREDMSVPLLEERFVKTDFCWMFFRNKEIVIPPHAMLCDGAYVISKFGEGSVVADLSDDEHALFEYMKILSENFEKKHSAG